MATANDSVRSRIEHARVELTPTRVALGMAMLAVLGFTLLVLQEPMMHDSLHNFRHGAGITCH